MKKMKLLSVFFFMIVFDEEDEEKHRDHLSNNLTNPYLR